MIISKASADAVKKLRAADNLTELEQLQIVQQAIDTETQPHQTEVENHRLLVNEHVEIARKTASDAAEALNAKENALIETRAKLVEAEAQIGHLNTLLSERDADIAKLRTEARDRDRTLELRTAERDALNAHLNPQEQKQQPGAIVDA